MANRYWVGNGGDWSDNTNHWSATSGGSPGASLPTSSDDVFFNGSSFSTTGQTVAISNGPSDPYIVFRSMDWTGALHAPTLAITNYSTIQVYGSLTFISGMSFTNIDTTTAIPLVATSGSWTITTGGTVIPGRLTVQGSGATWTLQDGLSVSGRLIFRRGTFNSNNQTIDVTDQIQNDQSGTASVTLGSSIVTVGSGGWGPWSTVGITLSAASSTINCAGPFDGAGKSYGTVNLTGTGACTVAGSNTFTTLATTTHPKTIAFTAGTTQTVTNFNVSGTAGSLITLQRTGPSGVWTISKASGTVACDYVSISNSTATGGATWNTTHSTDAGGNTGWAFGVNATTTPAGIGATSYVGAMDAVTGDALVTPIGTELATAVGTPTIQMDANVDVAGVEAVTAVGDPNVFADSATIIPIGIAASSASGAASAQGDAVQTPYGVVAVSYQGAVVVYVVQNPTVDVTGLQMDSAAGTPVPTGHPVAGVWMGKRCAWGWWRDR